MITEWATWVGAEFFLAELTQLERWEAVRRMRSELLVDPTFIAFEVFLVAGLAIVLGGVVYGRARKRGQRQHRSFEDTADRTGLSSDERKLLLDITSKAGLKRVNAIFTMFGAFEQGSAALMREKFSMHAKLDERRQLNARISTLRGKLNFPKKPRSSAIRAARARGLSSRQVPVGRGVLVTRRRVGAERIEATVVKNDEFELGLGLVIPAKSQPGEVWRVQCNLGASVWEFDAVTISCDGNDLVLSHSNEVRYINRRRFARVQMSARAFVAPFPFKSNWSGKKIVLPEFTAARLVELAGPGLQIETPLKLEVGDRVLVAFEPAKERIVQDLGQVRRIIKAGNKTRTVAIELIGLDEAGISDLVRVTNAAAIKHNSGLEQDAAAGIANGGGLQPADERAVSLQRV